MSELQILLHGAEGPLRRIAHSERDQEGRVLVSLSCGHAWLWGSAILPLLQARVRCPKCKGSDDGALCLDVPDWARQ